MLPPGSGNGGSAAAALSWASRHTFLRAPLSSITEGTPSLMADINICGDSTLPRSGIPIAAGLENVYISIAGLIGAGKTTLATALGETLGLPVYYEPVSDNVYLEDFYKDMKRYGFPLQIYLLNKRFRQQQQIVWDGRGGVQDRTIYEDAIFAKMLHDDGLMEHREYQTYLSLFNNMSNFMRKPNVIVYLDVTPEESYERIKMRSRECESSLPLEYLQKLSKAYEDFLEDISQLIPVLRVNWSRFHTAEEMAKQIQTEYAAMRTIRRIDWEPADASSPAPTTPPIAAAAKPRFDAPDVSDARLADATATKLQMDELLDRATSRASITAGVSPTGPGGETPQ